MKVGTLRFWRFQKFHGCKQAKRRVLVDSLRFFGWLGKLSKFSTVRNLSASSLHFKRFFWLICQRQLLQVTSSLEVHGHSSNLLRLRLVYLLHCTLPLCVILCCALVAVNGGASEIWGFQWLYLCWVHSSRYFCQPPWPEILWRWRRLRLSMLRCGLLHLLVPWDKTHRVPGKVEDLYGELAIYVDIMTLKRWYCGGFLEVFYVI